MCSTKPRNYFHGGLMTQILKRKQDKKQRNNNNEIKTNNARPFFSMVTNVTKRCMLCVHELEQSYGFFNDCYSWSIPYPSHIRQHIDNLLYIFNTLTQTKWEVQQKWPFSLILHKSAKFSSWSGHVTQTMIGIKNIRVDKGPFYHA